MHAVGGVRVIGLGVWSCCLWSDDGIWVLFYDGNSWMKGEGVQIFTYLFAAVAKARTLVLWLLWSAVADDVLQQYSKTCAAGKLQLKAFVRLFL